MDNSDSIIDIPNDDGTFSANRINLQTNTLFLYDFISDHVAKEVSDRIGDMAKHGRNLNVMINSAGGFLSSGQAILAELSRFPNEIHVDIVGICWSMAAIIALSGDTCKMSKFGLFMLHYPRWDTGDQSLAEHKLDVKVTGRLFDSMVKSLLSGTKISYSEYKKRMEGNTDWYLTAEQCKKLGIVSEIY